MVSLVHHTTVENPDNLINVTGAIVEYGADGLSILEQELRERKVPYKLADHSQIRRIMLDFNLTVPPRELSKIIEMLGESEITLDLELPVSALGSEYCRIHISDYDFRCFHVHLHPHEVPNYLQYAEIVSKENRGLCKLSFKSVDTALALTLAGLTISETVTMSKETFDEKFPGIMPSMARSW